MSRQTIQVGVLHALHMPMLPNFLRFADRELGSISVAEIPDASLREIAAAWTEALVEHAQELRRRREERS